MFTFHDQEFVLGTNPAVLDTALAKVCNFISVGSDGTKCVIQWTR